jgi:SMI1 / KNR4 family (SUKH-1)
VWSADAVRARLAAARAADPELRRFGADTHRYALGPPLDEAAVAEFEARHGVVLPAAHRSFLTEVGDGGAGPYYGLYPLDGSGLHPVDVDERARPGHLAAAFPHTVAWNPVYYGPHPEITEDDYSADEQTAGSLVICHYGCGALFRLVVTGPARGQVWFDDRCSGGGLTPGPDFATWYGDWLHSL